MLTKVFIEEAKSLFLFELLIERNIKDVLKKEHNGKNDD